MKTKVIFRKFKNDGSIIALFPEEIADSSPYHCLSYQHVGQHGSADPAIIGFTLPVKPAEYEPLKKELERIGYDLQVIKRYHHRSFLEARRAKLSASPRMAQKCCED